jgi:SAM-dependent methyltransferase
MSTRTLSILIPCYNEEKTLPELLARVEAANLGSWMKEIIVVDDGSTDKSREILEGFRRKLGYKIIFQPKNLGKGEAERTGIKEFSGDYLVLQDADLEYDPREISKMLQVVDASGAEVVFGSRNIGSPWKRAFRGFFLISLGVWVSTKLVNVLYSTKLTDAWTCYKLFSKKVAKEAKFMGNGFEADYIFIGEVASLGYSIHEVPITHAPRTTEEGKKIRYGDGFRSMWLLLLHRLAHLRRVPWAKAISRVPEDILACPICYSKIVPSGEQLACSNGHSFAKPIHGPPFLLEDRVLASNSEQHLSGVNWLKTFLKQFPLLYYAVWWIFCPVLMLVNGPRMVTKYLGSKGIILDVGSGPERLSENFINVDVNPFPEVDVVADASRLPFLSSSVDCVVSESMLEHVPDPGSVIGEMKRVLKPGGIVYLSVPFVHPFHASPDDFQRYTLSGLKRMFENFEIIKIGARSGPWSALLVFLAYYLGLVLSLGSARLAPILAHFFMLVLGPLKFLDIFFVYLPGAHAVSAHVFLLARKPAGEK